MQWSFFFFFFKEITRVFRNILLGWPTDNYYYFFHWKREEITEVISEKLRSHSVLKSAERHLLSHLAHGSQHCHLACFWPPGPPTFSILYPSKPPFRFPIYRGQSLRLSEIQAPLYRMGGVDLQGVAWDS